MGIHYKFLTNLPTYLLTFSQNQPQFDCETMKYLLSYATLFIISITHKK